MEDRPEAWLPLASRGEGGEAFVELGTKPSRRGRTKTMMLAGLLAATAVACSQGAKKTTAAGSTTAAGGSTAASGSGASSSSGGGAGGGAVSSCFVQLETRGSFDGVACATKHDGTLWCWAPGSTQATAMSTYDGGVAEVSLDFGVDDGCARRTDGTVACIFHASGCVTGPCDAGPTGPTGVTTITALGTSVAHMTGFGLYVCATDEDGTIRCLNGYAGTPPVFGPWTAPTKAALPAKVVQASAESEDGHVCAVLEGGALYCWGNNDRGQIGGGVADTPPVWPPAHVTALGTSVAYVSTGNESTCAVKTDGSAWCWGSDGMGQAGNGMDLDIGTPAPVMGLRNGVARVGSGNESACAVKTDGTVWCWGYNSNGQLGDGTTTSSKTPVQVMASPSAPFSGAVAVSVDVGYACALKKDDTIWCWGGPQSATTPAKITLPCP